jgi:methionyl-tRNA formyltransferase
VKVLFITQNDPIYVREFFDELANLELDGIDVVAVAIAPAMNKKTLLDLARQMLDFYGPVDFVRMGFRFVMAKIGARLPVSLRFGRTFSIQQAAEKAGIGVLEVANVNSPEFVRFVCGEAVDVIVSVAAPQIFRSDLIAAPALACINIHNARLPEYKGMLPNFWQMFDGRKQVGTTVHRINEAIDEGAILLQRDTEIRPGESLDSLIRRTKRKGAALVLEVLRLLETGDAVAIEPQQDSGSYFSFPTRSDVIEFRRRGYRLL